MAGSLTVRAYVSDNTTTYAIRVDKSNAIAHPTGGAGQYLCTPLTVNAVGLPQGFRKRYILCQNKVNPKIRRKFYLGNPTLIPNILSGRSITAETYPGPGDIPGVDEDWTVTFYRGESQRYPLALTIDTGLDDGNPNP